MQLMEKSFAVIGASNNNEKFGYKVVLALKKISSRIFPVNLSEKEILGLPVYSNLNGIKEKIDIIVFVVPPKVTFDVLKNSPNVESFLWFQPGSFDTEVINLCKKMGFLFENKKCIMEESKKQKK
jgi:predicted CoA-binding protein